MIQRQPAGSVPRGFHGHKANNGMMWNRNRTGDDKGTGLNLI